MLPHICRRLCGLGWYTIPPVEILPGHRRWQVQATNPLLLRGHPCRFMGVSCAISFYLSPKFPPFPVISLSNTLLYPTHLLMLPSTPAPNLPSTLILLFPLLMEIHAFLPWALQLPSRFGAGGGSMVILCFTANNHLWVSTCHVCLYSSGLPDSVKKNFSSTLLPANFHDIIVFNNQVKKYTTTSETNHFKIFQPNVS